MQKWFTGKTDPGGVHWLKRRLAMDGVEELHVKVIPGGWTESEYTVRGGVI